jgi:hypothetical protein
MFNPRVTKRRPDAALSTEGFKKPWHAFENTGFYAVDLYRLQFYSRAQSSRTQV